MIFNRSFVQYTKELSNELYNPLSKEEERELLIAFNDKGNNSSVALNKLINAHLRFVVYLLRDFKIPSSIDPMDLVQEGVEGLLYSLSKYDSSVYNCRVATYAQYYIKWYIAKALGLYDNKKNIIEHNLPEDFNFDTIVDPSSENIQEEAHQDILRYLKTLLEPREVKIISLLFGLEYPFKPKTLREVGLMFHIDAERVRQIKEEVLEKVKQKQNILELLR